MKFPLSIQWREMVYLRRTQQILFTVIWRRAYDQGPLKGNEIDLEDTFMCQLDDDSVVRLWKVSLCEITSQLLGIS